MQFLDDTLETVFERFKCCSLINAEYKRRALSQRVTVRSPDSRSIFHVYVNEYKRDCVYLNRAEVIVKKYNNQLKRFEKTVEIPLGSRTDFEVVLHKNKIFILGGYNDNGEELKSVST